MPDTFDADKITDGLFADPNGPHWEETRDALLAAHAAGQCKMRERAAAAVENPASELLQMAADDIRELPLTPAPTEEGDGTDDPQAERRP